jgi:hypothetical protein
MVGHRFVLCYGWLNLSGLIVLISTGLFSLSHAYWANTIVYIYVDMDKPELATEADNRT